MTCTFTKELLEEKINTGEHQVFAYPAGSGKTTAICEYIVDQIQHNKLERKIIYIAPTKSLLDTMYNKLVSIGLPKELIFNYHSSSEEYKACRLLGNRMNEKLHLIINSKAVILITHERMKFDIVQKFLSDLDCTMGRKPLVFLDESIEDCNIVKMPHFTLDCLLAMAGLISTNETHKDYLLKERTFYLDACKLSNYLTTPREFNKATNTYTIGHLELYSISLVNNIGFGINSDLTNPAIQARFINLYNALAKTVASGCWIENGNDIYINLPIAIHESWKNYSQIIIMDATAFIDSCFYKDYGMVLSTSWNSNLLTNYVSCSPTNSRTRLTENPQQIIDYLLSIDFNSYNKIYITTFKGPLQDLVYKFFKENYPNYYISYNATSSLEEFISTDIDNSTDELYVDSATKDKIIYITNFGRTRGSNIFRECDCIVQLGNYRINPNFLTHLSMIYSGLTSDQLALVNYLQELYRGRIRLNQSMTSYSLLETSFYNFMVKKLNSLNFKFQLKSNAVKPNYGKNEKLVQFLLNKKLTNTSITREELFQICQLTRWDKVKSRLLNLYKKYAPLRNTIFSQFKTIKDLKTTLTLNNASCHDYQLHL